MKKTPKTRLIPEATKKQRTKSARNAAHALAVYKENYDRGEGDETALVDLLSDIRHLADQRKWDIDDLLGQAEMHFNAERFGTPEGVQ